MTRAAEHGPAVALRGVTKVYRSHGIATAALNGVDLEARGGELHLLLGPSGSGKTTLLTIAAGFVAPTSGTVALFGRDAGAYAPRELQRLHAAGIGFIFQTFLLIDALTAEENVLLQLRFAGVESRAARQRALEAMERAGITHCAARRPTELSHGERQRVAIARAIASGARLLIADEPTASLDGAQGEAIIRLLHACAQDLGSCVLVASHDTRLRASADVIHMLENGRINGGVS